MNIASAIWAVVPAGGTLDPDHTIEDGWGGGVDRQGSDGDAPAIIAGISACVDADARRDVTAHAGLAGSSHLHANRQTRQRGPSERLGFGEAGFLRVTQEQRHGDSCKYADNQDDDEQFDQGKTSLAPLVESPLLDRFHWRRLLWSGRIDQRLREASEPRHSPGWQHTRGEANLSRATAHTYPIRWCAYLVPVVECRNGARQSLGESDCESVRLHPPNASGWSTLETRSALIVLTPGGPTTSGLAVVKKCRRTCGRMGRRGPVTSSDFAADLEGAAFLARRPRARTAPPGGGRGVARPYAAGRRMAGHASHVPRASVRWLQLSGRALHRAIVAQIPA